MEKTISIRNTEITFSIWDLGGQREFVNMLPLVCNDAVAILFMFDLSRKSTLNSVKEWYRQARGFNKVSPRTRSVVQVGYGGAVIWMGVHGLDGTIRRCLSTTPWFCSVELSLDGWIPIMALAKNPAELFLLGAGD